MVEEAHRRGKLERKLQSRFCKKLKERRKMEEERKLERREEERRKRES